MSVNEQYREAMGKALFLANRARETGDVPVGAVVVDADGHIIGRGWNCREYRYKFSIKVTINSSIVKVCNHNLLIQIHLFFLQEML